MSIMLPDELEWVLEMLGFHWPTADEDKLVQSAEVWEKFAADITELRATANTTASTVMSHNAGESIDKFKKAYDKFDDGGDGYLQDAAQAATVIAFALRGAAVLVVACKAAVIVQLIALAIQIAAAAAASVVTFGLSNAAGMAATAITRLTVRQLLDALKEALIEAVIECVKEPAVSALEAMITDLTRQTVNVGFGAQSGYDLSATVKAGAEGGWEAIKQTPQTFAESVRDGLGSKAGGAARHGAENFADSGPLGSGPATLSAQAGTGPEAGPEGSDASSIGADSSSDGPSVSSTVSADIGGDGPSVPDSGSGPASLPGSRDGADTLDDFTDPGSDSAPNTADSGPGGTSPGGSGANPGGISSPSPQPGPPPSNSDGAPSSNDGAAIGTQVDGLAATAPAATDSPPPPTTSDSSPPRGDGNNTIPTSPNSPSTGDSGPRNPPSQGGSSRPGGGTGTSPNPGSSAPLGNHPSTTPGTSSPGTSAPGTSAPGGPPASSNPSPGAPSSTPRTTPGEGGAPGGRPSGPHQGGAPGVATPVHTPGGNQPPQHAPSNPGNPNASPPGNPATPNTPPQAPAHNPPQQQATVIPVPVHTVTATPAPTPAPDPTSGQPAANHDNSNGSGRDDHAGAAPTPASATRDNTPPGGVNDPSHREQSALDNAVPRDENGDPTRPPDPYDGAWVERINGDGAGSPGRTNNCVDTALSTVDTFAGTPTAAGARTPDPDLDGSPSDRGEHGGRDRIENTLGARFSDMGNGRDAYNRLENTLRTSGHGSQAVIVTQDANGRAHAWNAVNHNGKITYIDAQSGRRGPYPLHNGNNGVFAVPLDSGRRPIEASGDTRGNDAGQRARTPAQARTTAQGRTTEQGRGSEQGRTAEQDRGSEQGRGSQQGRATDATAEQAASDRAPESAPAGPDRRVPDEPAGAPPTAGQDGTAEGTHPRDDPQRTDHPRLTEPETVRSTHYGMEPMRDQQNVRQTNDVRQLAMNPVHRQLKQWLTPVPQEDGTEGPRVPLVDALRSCGPPRPDDPNHEPTVLRHDDLKRILPGFDDLHPGERGAVVASMARLSHNFHESHGVGASPEPMDGYPRHGADRHATANWAANRRDQEITASLITDLGGVAASIENSGDHRPDITGTNYATVEVYDPESKKISYVVDSSYSGRDQKHSEKSVLDYLDALDEARGQRPGYEPLSLYTDREPCGRGTGYANCARLLSEKMPGVDVFYGTGYRKNGDIVGPTGLKNDTTRKQQFEEDLNKNLRKLGKMWTRALRDSGLRGAGSQ